MERKCLYCKKPIEGRIDKIYCDKHCRAGLHYQKKKEENSTTFFSKVDKQLKLNRRLLQHYNYAGLSQIRIEKLNEAGFNENVFTHFWKNKKGQVYLFCYDFGFLKMKEKNKFLLVEWQPYMSSKLKLD
jgi:hypothetical protein